jgi:predicted O-linked N-acetylglucosamine transferase (SPINDLY family)
LRIDAVPPAGASDAAEDRGGLAAALAADDHCLADLRQTLRRPMADHTLMNAPAYAPNFESALRQMWKTCCGKGAARP